MQLLLWWTFQFIIYNQLWKSKFIFKYSGKKIIVLFMWRNQSSKKKYFLEICAAMLSWTLVLLNSVIGNMRVLDQIQPSGGSWVASLIQVMDQTLSWDFLLDNAVCEKQMRKYIWITGKAIHADISVALIFFTIEKV